MMAPKRAVFQHLSHNSTFLLDKTVDPCKHLLFPIIPFPSCDNKLVCPLLVLFLCHYLSHWLGQDSCLHPNSLTPITTFSVTCLYDQAYSKLITLQTSRWLQHIPPKYQYAPTELRIH
jgi:hypothetical protein